MKSIIYTDRYTDDCGYFCVLTEKRSGASNVIAGDRGDHFFFDMMKRKDDVCLSINKRYGWADIVQETLFVLP